MGVHDSYLRLTPYEVAFADLPRAREGFRRLRGEASEIELADPGRFLFSEAAATLLDDLQGAEAGDRSREHGLLLYHAFHFWNAGEALFLADTPLARRLMTGSHRMSWEGELPWRAGYLQLPQHLLWAEVLQGSPPESVDGLFWSAPAVADHLSLLLVTGLRPDRAGFSVVPVLPAPLTESGHWTTLAGREDGVDFESSLPGAELEGLHQVKTAGEILKLMGRALAWLAQHPDPGAGTQKEGGRGPAPSRLPYRRMEL